MSSVFADGQYTRLWLQAIAQDPPPPSQLVQRAEYSLNLFPDWCCETPGGHIFRGGSVADWLVLDSATTATPLPTDWDALFPFQEGGFVSKQVADALVLPPRLVVSGSEPVSAECSLRLQVDEARAFIGYANYGSEGGRVYMLLARRGRLAWKIFLSIKSERDRDNQLKALRDQHRQAALVFGSLMLLDPTRSAES
jgi:hypothetical protein